MRKHKSTIEQIAARQAKRVEQYALSECKSADKIAHTPGNRDLSRFSKNRTIELLADQRDELLEACKELIRVCQWNAKTYGHSTNHTVIDAARAVIAKAKGA